MKQIKRISSVLFLLLISAAAAVGVYGFCNDDASPGGVVMDGVATPQDAAALQARGAYLARAGNCQGCHTARGGAAYAGGRVIASEFGNFIAPNITQDMSTGIGRWTADDFWRALHNGKARDGRLLYPAFPYPNYTQVTRADADAMFTYFKTVTPVRRENQPHALRFPYNQRALLAFWRALYFRPAVYRAESRQSAEWNRGAYLVQGLAHCSACHSSRNRLGANGGSADLSGGEIAARNWYAPSLLASTEANLSQWQSSHVAALLQTGVAPRASVSGPMAEVVAGSLQYLSPADIQAMTVYLQTLPASYAAQHDLLGQALAAAAPEPSATEQLMAQGAALYKTHCSDCHAADGRGVPSVYPALQGNPGVQTPSIANSVRMILAGGFAPSTSGNPRPYGMPPFGPVLKDQEIAILLSYIRNAWGNQGSVVTAAQVNRYRSAPLD